MRVLVDITHPAYAHFFRVVIPELEAEGHHVRVTSRRKDVTTDLLDAAGIEHSCLSTCKASLVGLLLEMLARVWRLCREIRAFRPDVILARDGAYACQAGWLMRVPAISFDDTDDAPLQHLLYLPFAWRVYTDQAYRKRIGARQRLYRGVSCLAYLGPRRFTPDIGVLDEIEARPGDRLVLCRLVSWTANHDIGHHGFARDSLVALLTRVSEHGRVLLTSETPLPPELEPYRTSLAPQRLHHLMAYCSLYIGESATMAAECAVLGVPAVHVSTRRVWYTDELEDRGLVHNVQTADQCLEKALGILADPDAEVRHAHLRDSYVQACHDPVAIVHEALSEVIPSDPV